MKKKTAAKPSLLSLVISALEDLKAQNIVTLDVTSLTDVTDHLVIASGSSSRQVRALAEHTAEQAKKQGMPAMGMEGIDAGEWVLVDFGDVVLHVMQPETREFYDLERLWRAPETAAPTAARPAKVATTTRKPRATTETAVATENIETQGAKARARKSPPKPVVKKAAANSKADKPALEKAGVYARTGTRKPASKTAVAKKTPARSSPAKSPAASPAASKPATSSSPAAKPSTRSSRPTVGITREKKPATRKPRQS